MPVTLRYENGTAAVFATEEEALDQALHDSTQPGHVDPKWLFEGDWSTEHSEWRQQLLAQHAERHQQLVDTARLAAVAAHQAADDEARNAAINEAVAAVPPPDPVPDVVDPPPHVTVLRTQEQLVGNHDCPLCNWHLMDHEERKADGERPAGERRNPWQ